MIGFECEKGEIPLWTDALVKNRDELVEYLNNLNIECRKFWYPLHTQKPYKSPDAMFPVATKMSSLALWLPSALNLNDKDILFVAKKIRKFFTSKIN